MPVISVWYALVTLLHAYFVCVAKAQSNISSIFSPHLSPGAKIYAGSGADSEYVVPRYSRFDDPSFILVILPATIQDVQNVVKLANQHNISFFATGGGHGVQVGYATVKGAVNIQLQQLNTTTLDPVANRLIVGPGNDFVSIYDVLFDSGKQTVVGNSPCVNIIGATVGAGIGPFQGQYGFVLDTLRSVTIVTACGDLVEASEDVNPDLFWAVRGAGANFGIIVSAAYEVYDAPNEGRVVVGDFSYNPASNVSLFQLLASFDDEHNFPNEMSLTIASSYNKSSSKPTLSASITFIGNQSQAQPYIDKFLALQPIIWNNFTVGWNELSATQAGGNDVKVCARGGYSNHFNVGADRTDVATYSRMFERHAEFNAANADWYSGGLVFQRYGISVAQSVPEDKRGVYPGRDIKTQIVYDNTYDGPDHDAQVEAYCREGRSEFLATSGFETLHLYLNYGFGGSEEGPEAWFGAQNLPRLSALKRKWDPLRKFGAGNPVPLYWPE